jgi:hypothetical protein
MADTALARTLIDHQLIPSPDDHLHQIGFRSQADVTKLQRAIVDGLEDVKAHDIQVFNTEHCRRCSSA